MLDAKVLNSILDSEGIALVNPFCKKKVQKSVDNKTFTQDSLVLVVSSDAVCNPAFNLAKIAWFETETTTNFQDYSYLNPAVISTYFAKNYPPPKELVA